MFIFIILAPEKLFCLQHRSFHGYSVEFVMFQVYTAYLGVIKSTTTDDFIKLLLFFLQIHSSDTIIRRTKSVFHSNRVWVQFFPTFKVVLWTVKTLRCFFFNHIQNKSSTLVKEIGEGNEFSFVEEMRKYSCVMCIDLSAAIQLAS